jgi:hypothetical protein
MYRLLGRKSKFSTSNKLLICKAILKPIWIYGIQLWGTASISNTEILERFKSKALRMIVDAPWYVPNTVIRRDLQIPTVKEEIWRYSSQYSARLSAHPNALIVNLIELPDNRRLRRHLPSFCGLDRKSHYQSHMRLEPISYRGALLSTLLHAIVYVFTQSAECTGTDCKWNGITKITNWLQVTMTSGTR